MFSVGPAMNPVYVRSVTSLKPYQCARLNYNEPIDPPLEAHVFVNKLLN